MRVDELQESNNVRVGNRVVVGAGPDLVVTSIDAPPSAESSVDFPISAPVCNQGTEPSPVASLTLARSHGQRR